MFELTFTEYELDPAAARHIRERFAAGDEMKHWPSDGGVPSPQSKHLSRYLSRRPDIEQGTITALLPSGLTRDRLDEFGNGFQAERARPLAWIVEMCEAYLRETENGIVVFEEPLALASDPWAKRGIEIPHFLVGDNIYYFAACDTDATVIQSMIREASSAWPGELAVLAKAPWLELPKHGSQVVEADIARLAQSAERLVVGAYDDDAYLLWTQEAGRPR